jgi:glycosyltransferase involved in cell wall biosynthesis
MKNNLTAIIIAKNEAKMIAACLETLLFCEKIIVLDTGSSDRTVAIAESYGAKVVHFAHDSFAKLREKAASLVETDWLFYVDADERVTPALAKEILLYIEQNKAPVMALYRRNVCYGHHFRYGNWENDQVTRVFHRDHLLTWTGEIHESPVFKGEVVTLQHQLIHLTHRNTADNLAKSAEWTIKEARGLAAAATAKVGFWTIIRKGVMEFYRRALKHQGYKDGLAGLVEALVQAMNRMMVYIQVWELQQKPSLEKRYEREEQEIRRLWHKEGKISV